MAVRQAACRTLGYIAIIAISMVTLFVVVLDVLKYGFGVDDVRSVNDGKQATRRRHSLIVLRFMYVNELKRISFDSIAE